MESSICEKPERHASRRLSDHLVLEGRKQKVHSLVDKVYSRKNLKLAWERVRANQGASGADKVTIEEFETRLDENLERLHQELRENTYQPQAVRRLEIPKRGAPGKRPADPPDRNAPFHRLERIALTGRNHLIGHRRLDKSGADGVDPDAARRIFQSRALGEPDNPVLCGVVDAALGAPHKSTERRAIDDGAAFLFAH